MSCNFFEISSLYKNPHKIKPLIIYYQQSKQMKDHVKTFAPQQRAWFQTMPQKYVPIIVIKRTSLNKVLVADDFNGKMPSGEYQVDDSKLLPRSTVNSVGNLMEMQYLNIPQMLRYLTIIPLHSTQQEQKWINLSENVMIEVGYQNGKSLIPFFKYQTQSLLSSSIANYKHFIIANSETDRHLHASNFLAFVSQNTQLWPYKIKLGKIQRILDLFLGNLSLEIELKFYIDNSTYNPYSAADNIFRNNRAVMQINIHPYLPCSPSAGLAVPFAILNAVDCKQFSQKYQGPHSNKTESMIEPIIDALLNLGVSVAEVHSLFKLLSIIANLQQIKVVSSGDGYQLIDKPHGSPHNEQAIKTSNIENASYLLKMQKNQLIKIIVDQSYSLEHSDFTEQQKITYRLHVFKYILYEIFVCQICQILNQKLFSENLRQSKSSTKIVEKKLILYSHVVNSSEPKSEGERVDCYFYCNVREMISQRYLQKIKQKIKESITSSISLNKIHDKCLNYSNLLAEQSHSPQVQYNSLIRKQQQLHSLYKQLLNLPMISQISINMFNRICKYEKLHDIPSVFQGALNPDDQRFFIIPKQILKGDYQFCEQILEVIHKQQIDHCPRNSTHSITLNLYSFANRYKFTEFCKQIHRKYDRNKEKYIDNEKINEKFMGNVKMYCSKQQQSNLQIVQGGSSRNQWEGKIVEVRILNRELFVELERDVEREGQAIHKIIRQFRVYKVRNRTLTRVFKIFRERKLEKILRNKILRLKKSVIKDIRVNTSIKIIVNLLREKIYAERMADWMNDCRIYGALKKLQSIYEFILKRRAFAELQKYGNSKKFQCIFESIEKRRAFKQLFTFVKNSQQPKQQEMHSTSVKKQPQQKKLSSVNQPEGAQQKKNDPKVEPKVEPKVGQKMNDPKVEQKVDEPKVEPKVEQKTEKMNEPKVEQKVEQKKSELKVEQKTEQKLEYGYKSQMAMEEMKIEQLKSFQDNPKVSLDQWEKMSKIKPQELTSLIEPLFAKYKAVEEKKTVNIEEVREVKLGLEVIEILATDTYLSYCRENAEYEKKENPKEGENEKIFEKTLSNQNYELANPLLKYYPMKQYQKIFKQTFNAILKIGVQKNTTKKLHELLNVLETLLIESYNHEIKGNEKNNIFDEAPVVSSGYNSLHNILKDQIFMQFCKQTTKNGNIDSMNGLFKGLLIFTRYYCPSPVLLYPFISHIFNLLRVVNQQVQAQSSAEILLAKMLLETIQQNTAMHAEAFQNFKDNNSQFFSTKQKIKKNQIENAGYLKPRVTRIQESEIFKTTKQITKNQMRGVPISVYLLNNQSFTFIIRNEIMKTLKKKVLYELKLLNKEPCFGIFYSKDHRIFANVDDCEKAIDYMGSQKSPIFLYLKIRHYFPFSLKQNNIVRLTYLDIVSEEHTFPWQAKQYEDIVVQSMSFDQFEQLRIFNYLCISNQTETKNPNFEPIHQKYKSYISTIQNKFCEFEYLKTIKTVGFFLIKCFKSKDEKNYIVGVKPIELIIFREGAKYASIEISKIRNVYMQASSVVVEIQCNKEKDENKIFEFKNFYREKELFNNILHHVRNRI